MKSACFYDPDVNPTYLELATHYGTAVLPTRKGKARDKARAEAGFCSSSAWILARLRKRSFFSLSELNREIRRLLDELNERRSRSCRAAGARASRPWSGPRSSHFHPPVTNSPGGRWPAPTIDYHIDVLGHFYSVPHRLARKQEDVRITSTTVEIFHDHRRVAAHPRSFRQGGFTTEPSHRPKSHQRHLERTPSRIICWAEKTGPKTAELAQHIMDARPHPEQGYRACLGLFRLGEDYGSERLEAACTRALEIGGSGISYRSVKSILRSGLDRVPKEKQTSLDLPQAHEHVRGAHYYATSDNGDSSC